MLLAFLFLLVVVLFARNSASRAMNLRMQAATEKTAINLIVGLNPALQRTIDVPNLKAGSVNRAKSAQVGVGGKGCSWRPHTCSYLRHSTFCSSLVLASKEMRLGLNLLCPLLLIFHTVFVKLSPLNFHQEGTDGAQMGNLYY